MKEKQFLKFTFSLIVNKLFGGHMGLPAAVIGLFFVPFIHMRPNMIQRFLLFRL